MGDLFGEAQQFAQQSMQQPIGQYGGMYQQMPQPDPYSAGYSQYPPSNGYQQYQMGVVDNYGMIRYSKHEYLDGLRNYILYCCNFQVTINKEEKIEDLPDKLRHCCAESASKIVMLDRLAFNVPETGMSIPFYFCRDCGKLFYYKDFMG